MTEIGAVSTGVTTSAQLKEVARGEIIVGRLTGDLQGALNPDQDASKGNQPIVDADKTAFEAKADEKS